MIDLTSFAYTQTPPCGYTYTEVFTWTIPLAATSYIQQSTPVPKAITVQASAKAAVGTHQVVLNNAITDNNQGGPQNFTPTITFNVIIVDPCDSSVITPHALSAQTIVNGASYEWTFQEAVIAIETANENKKLCGDRLYKVFMPDGTTEVTGVWMTVTETPAGSGTYKLKAEPILDSLVTGGALSLKFKTTLPSQPNHSGITEDLLVTVVDATCNCDLITWDNPQSIPATLSVLVAAQSGNTVTIPEATLNTASKTATPAIRVCAKAPQNGCTETYTSALVEKTSGSLPNWMSVQGTTLTVTPTTGAHIGVWTMKLT